MIQFFEWHHAWREVFTDGRALPAADAVEPTWNGTSIGRWDGNVFIVDSIGFDDRTWLDKFGYPREKRGGQDLGPGRRLFLRGGIHPESADRSRH